ncbi:MAG: hypothetical protein WBQ83_24155, partial [Candidatus Acidiferrales bacterium]
RTLTQARDTALSALMWPLPKFKDQKTYVEGKRLSNTPVRQAGGCVEVSRCPQKQSYQRPSDVPVRKFRSWWLSLLAAVCGGASFVGIGV